MPGTIARDGQTRSVAEVHATRETGLTGSAAKQLLAKECAVLKSKLWGPDGGLTVYSKASRPISFLPRSIEGGETLSAESAPLN